MELFKGEKVENSGIGKGLEFEGMFVFERNNEFSGADEFSGVIELTGFVDFPCTIGFTGVYVY